MPKLFHAFVNPVADQAGFTGTKPSDWNGALEYANAADTGPSGTDASIRELLTANRTYYVRTGGSDSNAGLVNDDAHAFATYQKAMNVITASLDLAGFTVTVSIQNAAWTASLNCTTWAGGGAVIFDWNGGSVTVSGGAFALGVTADFLPGGGVTFQNVTVSTTGGGADCVANYGGGGGIVFGAGVVFGAASGVHMAAYSPNAQITQGNDYSITGAAASHMYNDGGILFNAGNTVTITGTLNFPSAFFSALDNSLSFVYSLTFSGGTVTGQRHNLSLSAVASIAGGGANYFPGNAAGTPVPGTLGADGAYIA